MITVHHLRVGRPIFTLWLIEELGLDYELKIYDRNEMGRAPPELKEVHPLGKSPVIVDDGQVISESGAIAMHLIENYDSTGRFSPDGETGACHLVSVVPLHRGVGLCPLTDYIAVESGGGAEAAFDQHVCSDRG